MQSSVTLMLTLQVDNRGRQGSKAGWNLYTFQSMQVTHQRWLLVICLAGVGQALIVILISWRDWHQKFQRLLQTERKPRRKLSTEHFSRFKKRGVKSLSFTEIDATYEISLYGQDLTPLSPSSMSQRLEMWAKTYWTKLSVAMSTVSVKSVSSTTMNIDQSGKWS